MTWLDQLFEVPFKKGDPKTFPSDVPLREIDFVIFTPGAFDVTTHEAIYEAMISDHRPVLPCSGHDQRPLRGDHLALSVSLR
jgi:endonuclease/exonuclease/phosphatase family metal-dependent hydrolase